jgi:hypothetical protein
VVSVCVAVPTVICADDRREGNTAKATHLNV